MFSNWLQSEIWFKLQTQYPGSVVPLAMFSPLPSLSMSPLLHLSCLPPQMWESLVENTGEPPCLSLSLLSTWRGIFSVEASTGCESVDHSCLSGDVVLCCQMFQSLNTDLLHHWAVLLMGGMNPLSWDHEAFLTTCCSKHPSGWICQQVHNDFLDTTAPFMLSFSPDIKQLDWECWQATPSSEKDFTVHCSCLWNAEVHISSYFLYFLFPRSQIKIVQHSFKRWFSATASDHPPTLRSFWENISLPWIAQDWWGVQILCEIPTEPAGRGRGRVRPTQAASPVVGSLAKVRCVL